MFTSYMCRPSGGGKIAVVGIKPPVIRKKNGGRVMLERMFVMQCDARKYNGKCESINKGDA